MKAKIIYLASIIVIINGNFEAPVTNEVVSENKISKLIMISEKQNPTIESVVSSNYVPPVTTINNSPIEAVNLILDALTHWAAIKCTESIDASLGEKWEDTKFKYIGTIPPGSRVEFLVLINKFDCNVIGLVHKTQIVRVKDNACSVNDIKLESPDLIYDPDQTGFFTIKINF